MERVNTSSHHEATVFGHTRHKASPAKGKAAVGDIHRCSSIPWLQASPPTCAQTQGGSLPPLAILRSHPLRVYHSTRFTPTGLLRQVYSDRFTVDVLYSDRFTPTGLLHQVYSTKNMSVFRQYFSDKFPPSTCLFFTHQCPTTDELGGCEPTRALWPLAQAN
jgi:hypothetical protein